MYQRVSHSARRFLDFMLPPTCPGCQTVVAEPQTLCPECWHTLTFLGPPCCDGCGHPFDYAVPDRTLCGACVREHPPFDRARAALLYDEKSRDLVLAFKHADRTETTRLFAKWMAQAGRDLLSGTDVIVPVPLHWTRLFQRRYNQSVLLAHGLGKLTGKTVLPDGLLRTRNTPSQGRFGRLGRARNVRGAFKVKPRTALKLQDKRVLLVDDVYTTGATLRSCAKVLRRAGASGVDVLVLARVVRGFV